MKKITELIKEKRVYFDGGTGTMLQSMGLPAGRPPELWNIEHPEKITALHNSYFDAGCNIVKTNTFGINRCKFENYRELIRAGIACAKKAAQGREEAYVAFDMGPTGRLLEPLGDLSFEEAVSVYADNIKDTLAHNSKMNVELRHYLGKWKKVHANSKSLSSSNREGKEIHLAFYCTDMAAVKCSLEAMCIIPKVISPSILTSQYNESP